MASVSNTGRSITIAFTAEEKARIEERGGDDWKWQVASFDIDANGIGSFTLRADMHEGRKMGLMTNVEADRWMLVIQSHLMPLVPYFSRIKVDATLTDADPKVTRIFLPKELPTLPEAKIARLAQQKKPTPKAKKAAPASVDRAPEPVAQSTALVPQPQQRAGSNLTLLIEGKSFRYEVPIEDRLRIMSDLARFAVVKEA